MSTNNVVVSFEIYQKNILTLNHLSATMVIFNIFYYPIKSRSLEKTCVFKHQYLQMFGPEINKYFTQFIEVVGEHLFVKCSVSRDNTSYINYNNCMKICQFC